MHQEKKEERHSGLPHATLPVVQPHFCLQDSRAIAVSVLIINSLLFVSGGSSNRCCVQPEIPNTRGDGSLGTSAFKTGKSTLSIDHANWRTKVSIITPRG